MFSCKSGEHTQCAPYTYLRRSIRKEGRRGRSGERPLNGVTPRQSHHLSIVWAKPSKSTANRFCLPSLLRHSPPRALLLSRVQAHPLPLVLSRQHRACRPTPSPSATKGGALPPFISNFQLSIFAPHLSARNRNRNFPLPRIPRYRFATQVARNLRLGRAGRLLRRSLANVGSRSIIVVFYRWNVGEDGVLGKKLVETVSYESIYVHTCVFFGTSGESITWECESRRSRRRKKKIEWM